MKTRGRKRPADAQLLLTQVSDEFGKRKRKLGAKRAADELGVCLASFYKYVRKENLPDMEVLRNAAERWGIKWIHLDPSEVLKTRKVQTAEQYVFAFLKGVREEDVEVVEIGPKSESSLQVVLKIHFPA